MQTIKDILLAVERIRMTSFLLYDADEMLNDIIRTLSPESVDVLRQRVKEQPAFVIAGLKSIRRILLEYGPVADKLVMITNIMNNKHVKNDVKDSFKSEMSAAMYRKQQLLKMFLAEETFVEKMSYEILTIRYDLFLEYKKEIKNGTTGDDLPFINRILEMPVFETDDELFVAYIKREILGTYDYEYVLEELDNITSMMNKYYETHQKPSVSLSTSGKSILSKSLSSLRSSSDTAAQRAPLLPINRRSYTRT